MYENTRARGRIAVRTKSGGKTSGHGTVGPDVSSSDLHPLLRLRRSSRTFDPSYGLPEEVLVLLLEAARWAPSAGNSQPWAFVVARRGEPAHHRMVARLSRGTAAWAPAAAALVLTLHRVGHDEDPAMAFSDYALYDLGQAVAHLTVQAEALGLQVHQFAGFDHDGAATEFGVTPAWRVTTGLAIGQRPAGEPTPTTRRERKPLSELVFTDGYGVPRWP